MPTIHFLIISCPALFQYPAFFMNPEKLQFEYKKLKRTRLFTELTWNVKETRILDELNKLISGVFFVDLELWDEL